MVREVAHRERSEAWFWRREVDVRAHMVKIERREVYDRPVNFHREKELCKAGEDAEGATLWRLVQDAIVRSV